MQTLLIYAFLPEEVRLYLIPEAPEWLKECDGQYINAGGEAESLLLRVGDAINPTQDHCFNPEDELATMWAQYRVEGTVDIEGPVRVVSCGFYL